MVTRLTVGYHVDVLISCKSFKVGHLARAERKVRGDPCGNGLENVSTGTLTQVED